MKDFLVSQNILPIGELKTHISRIIKQLRSTNRPFVITQNGKPAAVLITPELFDRLNENARFIEAVDEGLSDSVAGRTAYDEELGRELDATFGPLER